MNQLIVPVLELSQLHKGKPLTLYSGVMRSEDLLERYHVPTIQADALNGDSGYQRPPIVSRTRLISSYVLKKGGLLPTSILVNIREGGAYKKTKDGIGHIVLPEGRILIVMDGQHRIMGLLMARELFKGPLPYWIPVVFTLNLSEIEEAEVFFTVNHEARSVPTDVTEILATRGIARDAAAGKTVSPPKLRVAASTNIVMELAKRPTSVWFEKIQRADEVKTNKPIRLATFAHSLGPLLQSDWASTLVHGRHYESLIDCVDNYWKALAVLMPQAFSTDDYCVQGPTGAWVFGFVLRDFARFADKADDWSVEFFTEQLQQLAEWVDETTWHKETGAPLARAKGGGAARLIFEQIVPLYRESEVTDAAELIEKEKAAQAS